jgi:hypothetical protein
MIEAAPGEIEHSRGSRIAYALVTKGTEFVPGRELSGAKETTLTEDGIILFIDERPDYDWAHAFQLLSISNKSKEPEVLFRGGAIPDFTFRKPDGSLVTAWEEY